MLAMWITVAMLVVGLGAWLMLRGERDVRGERAAPRSRHTVSDVASAAAESGPRPAAAVATPAVPADPAPGAATPASELPAELAAWKPVSADSLPPQRMQGVAKTFQEVPRPPRLLSRLVGLDLGSANGSHELVNLINGEPLIAAKVLAAVNAPAYGLQRPVNGVGQAVTYLGLNTVRAICMHLALQQGFRSDGPDRTDRLKRIWQASALAGELVQQTSPRLSLPDTGGLACAVLLSFLGELAVTVAVPRGLLRHVVPRDHFARCRSEQTLIGLGGPEIGRVLMRGWELPESVIAGVAALDARLVQPVAAGCDIGMLREAWGYLCARLGERLAAGELASLADFDLQRDTSVELAAIRPLHADPRFAALLEQLAAAPLQARIEALMIERRVPRAQTAATSAAHPV
jgi:HD-like signal output (HDOD) protein